MTKEEAIRRLGGSIASAAKAIGISYQAVHKWPEELPPRIADRVIAAEIRMAKKESPAERGESI